MLEAVLTKSMDSADEFNAYVGIGICYIFAWLQEKNISYSKFSLSSETYQGG